MKSLIFNNLDYHPQLIKTMATATLMGAVGSNFIGPLIVFFVLYKYIPLSYLLIWLFIHFTLLITRFSISKKILRSINSGEKNLKNKLLLSMIVSSLSAFLYAVILWVSLSFSIPETHLFIVIISIFSLAAGSISTLGSIFHAFMSFFILMIVPVIIALIYHGGEFYLLLALILSVFFIIHSISGYRHYIALRDASTLQDSFKTIFDQTSDGILLIKKNRFKDCNDSLVSMFGYKSKEELLSTHVDNFSPKNQADGLNSHRKMIFMLSKAWEEGNTSYEWLHVRKDLTYFWTEIVLTRIHLNGENLIYGVWRDISARKEAEFELEALNTTLERRVEIEIEKNRLSHQKLLQHSRMAQMGEMISMIAHQWRQPLSAISSTAVNLQLKLELENFDLKTQKGADECNEYFQLRLENIETYVQNLTHTIDDFRNFYKPNKQSVFITLEEVIFKSLSVIKASLENDNIEIIQKYASEEKYELYDNELMQVILNILKNSQDNFKEKNIQNPYIRITTQAKQISICDNGGGIDEAIIEKVFDPYFSTKDEKNGTGLGLYMSKTIIDEHHKGSLHVKNDDKGICFIIELGEI